MLPKQTKKPITTNVKDPSHIQKKKQTIKQPDLPLPDRVLSSNRASPNVTIQKKEQNIKQQGSPLLSTAPKYLQEEEEKRTIRFIPPNFIEEAIS